MKKVEKKYARKKHAIVAVDITVFGIIENELKVLLIQTNKDELRGKWALPGGLVKIDENLEETAFRILKEKTGIKNIFLDQLATFGNPERDPFGRVISVAYIALVNADNFLLQTTSHYNDIKWFSAEISKCTAYDHKEILKKAIERLKNKIAYTNIAQGILPKFFTLTQLQNIYEIIWKKNIDKRNFRKKILKLNLLEETNKKEEGVSYRPARLYKFKEKKLREIDIF